MLEKLLTIRRPKSPIDRLTTYIYLECLGFDVPDFGQVEKLLKTHDPVDQCVVWTCGQSFRTNLYDAARRWPSSYAAMFVGNAGSVSVSCRFIQIGPRGYWFDLVSLDDWRSNQGQVEFVGEIEKYHSVINLPFFSIDFVRGSQKIYAIDFDIEPNLRGLGFKLLPKQFKKLYREGQKHFESVCT